MIWDFFTGASFVINGSRGSRAMSTSALGPLSLLYEHTHILLDQKLWYQCLIKESKLTLKVPGPHVPGQNSMFQIKMPTFKMSLVKMSSVRLSECLRSRRSEYPRQKFSVVLVNDESYNLFILRLKSQVFSKIYIFCNEFHTRIRQDCLRSNPSKMSWTETSRISLHNSRV